MQQCMGRESKTCFTNDTKIDTNVSGLWLIWLSSFTAFFPQEQVDENAESAKNLDFNTAFKLTHLQSELLFVRIPNSSEGNFLG